MTPLGSKEKVTAASYCIKLSRNRVCLTACVVRFRESKPWGWIWSNLPCPFTTCCALRGPATLTWTASSLPAQVSWTFNLSYKANNTYCTHLFNSGSLSVLRFLDEPLTFDPCCLMSPPPPPLFPPPPQLWKHGSPVGVHKHTPDALLHLICTLVHAKSIGLKQCCCVFDWRVVLACWSQACLEERQRKNLSHLGLQLDLQDPQDPRAQRQDPYINTTQCINTLITACTTFQLMCIPETGAI